MGQVSRALLLVEAEPSERLEAVRAYATAQQIELVEISADDLLIVAQPELEGCNHLLAVLKDEQVAAYVDCCGRVGLSLGIVPWAKQIFLHDWFHVPHDLSEAIELAFADSPVTLDLLRCNGETALGMVILGDTPFIDQRSKVYRNRRYRWVGLWFFRLLLLWSSVRALFSIRPFAIALTTSKEDNLHTAITGLVVIENDLGSAAAKLVGQQVEVQDGLFSALLIAPKSIKDYLWFLCQTVLRDGGKAQRLPQPVSLLRSTQLVVEAQQPLVYFVDGLRREAQRIEFKLDAEAVQINLPGAYAGRASGKEVHRTENLPRNADRLKQIEDHLPLFTRAVEDDFRELFIQLRNMSKPHSTFINLIILSAVVATMGLFLSSPAVIIGAMVLAPLMSPIISLAMGVLRGDRSLIWQSLKTVMIGMSMAIGTAAILAQFMPFEHLTSEMAGRLQPNLLDLGVAIAAGLAGGYAHVREDVAKSVSGVAIAVALVPPLCVVGIGVGWWDWHIASGAMLLFLTNLVGITLSAALCFRMLGFAPLVQVRGGMLVTSLLLLLLMVPLWLSFENMTAHWRLERDLSSAVFDIEGKPLRLTNLVITVSDDKVLIKADVLSTEPISHANLEQLKAMLKQKITKPFSLEVTTRIQL